MQDRSASAKTAPHIRSSDNASWVMRPITSLVAKLSDMGRMTPGTTATS